MFRDRLLRLVFTLVAVCLGTCPGRSSAAGADCPANQMSFGGSIYFSSSAAVVDTTALLGHIAYDLVQGFVSMQQCCSLGGVHLDAFDDYDIIGVPNGTPVSLTAVLTVDGAVYTAGCGGTGCGGYYVARLIHGTEVAEAQHSDHLFQGRIEHHDVLSIPLTIIAGQPERLEFKLDGARSPGGSHGSEARGVLSFTGLPAGASVVSCQGFGVGPTPARRSSWGRLKSIYR